ncbi:hypothetical protein RRG08_042597 [Elysia crispata]|uniref:Uncharacterized protein n=1 Tax=Elysia crispata TaxID=231223 RepID=A0AAE1CKB8_9GAST|nr:hypothetical protein RRG08_042597 [Elysia crispata]
MSYADSEVFDFEQRLQAPLTFRSSPASSLPSNRRQDCGKRVAMGGAQPRVDMTVQIYVHSELLLAAPKWRSTTGSGNTDSDDLYKCSLQSIGIDLATAGVNSLDISENLAEYSSSQRIIKFFS